MVVEPCRYFALAFVLLFVSPASASPPEMADRSADNQDLSIGAPYRVGERDNASVPLRDYMSSRIDALRVEMLDKLDNMEKRQRELDAERDNRYAQRFAAQQEALTAALQAAKEAVANALSAAKEAVTKAEDASNKRFDSVNEFRQQLSDQANNFMGKEAGEARFKALEDKAASNSARLDNIKSLSEGAGNLWAYLIGAGGLLLAVFAFVSKLREPVRAT